VRSSPGSARNILLFRFFISLVLGPLNSLVWCHREPSATIRSGAVYRAGIFRTVLTSERRGRARATPPVRALHADDPTEPQHKGSTLGVYSFGLIFVSARTNKRHHHQFLDPDPAYLKRSSGALSAASRSSLSPARNPLAPAALVALFLPRLLLSTPTGATKVSTHTTTPSQVSFRETA
jgi:hypothetical protein